LATESNFSEKCYLTANRDVVAAIKSRVFSSGFAHFLSMGISSQGYKWRTQTLLTS